MNSALWTGAASAALLATAAVPAQTFTSPAGYLTKEAPSDYFPLNGLLPHITQVVQVDNTLVGTPRAGIHTLAWRRDGGAMRNVNFVSQTMDVEVRMGHADWSLVQPGTKQDLSAFVVGGLTTVFQRKAVVLPDWEKVPATLPAPWDFALTLDVPWNYDGQQALLWQMQIGPPQFNTETPVDSISDTGCVAARAIGAGCQVAGMPGLMDLSGQLVVYGNNGRWRIAVHDAPPNAPLALGIGLRDPNLNIGACTIMHSSHDVVALAGQTGPTGLLWWWFSFTHDPTFIGVPLYVQAFAPDPQQGPVPFAFSQALEHVYPALNVPPDGIALGYFAGFAWGWQNTFTLYSERAIITGMAAR